jgi:hypothetical protein
MTISMDGVRLPLPPARPNMPNFFCFFLFKKRSSSFSSKFLELFIQ